MEPPMPPFSQQSVFFLGPFSGSILPVTVTPKPFIHKTIELNHEALVLLVLDKELFGNFLNALVRLMLEKPHDPGTLLNAKP